MRDTEDADTTSDQVLHVWTHHETYNMQKHPKLWRQSNETHCSVPSKHPNCHLQQLKLRLVPNTRERIEPTAIKIIICVKIWCCESCYLWHVDFDNTIAWGVSLLKRSWKYHDYKRLLRVSANYTNKTVFSMHQRRNTVLIWNARYRDLNLDLASSLEF